VETENLAHLSSPSLQSVGNGALTGNNRGVVSHSNPVVFRGVALVKHGPHVNAQLAINEHILAGEVVVPQTFSSGFVGLPKLRALVGVDFGAVLHLHPVPVTHLHVDAIHRGGSRNHVGVGHRVVFVPVFSGRLPGFSTRLAVARDELAHADRGPSRVELGVPRLLQVPVVDTGLGGPLVGSVHHTFKVLVEGHEAISVAMAAVKEIECLGGVERGPEGFHVVVPLDASVEGVKICGV